MLHDGSSHLQVESAERRNKLKKPRDCHFPGAGQLQISSPSSAESKPFWLASDFSSHSFLPVAPIIVSTSGLGQMPLAVERGEHRPFRRLVLEAEAEAEAAEVDVTALETGDTPGQCS